MQNHLSSRRVNNFDFLRFLFAVFVIITHSYALSGLESQQDLLQHITNNQASFSSIGLSGFFVISGYFIFKSFERSSHFYEYLKKRVLRVFPALLVVLLLSLLFVGSIYEGKTPLLLNSSFWTYLPNNLSLYGFQGVISGVFEENSYHSINGSLWTIQYEFSLYLAIALLFFIKGRPIFITIVISFIVLVMLSMYHLWIDTFGGVKILGMQGLHILNLGSFFVVGSLLAILDFTKWNSKMLVSLLFIIILVFFKIGLYNQVKHILFPPFIVGLGFLPVKHISNFSKFGDPSYGIYIYAFPVQQLLIYLYRPIIEIFIILSISISILFGYLSWHLIEKRAMLYKQRRS
ncbi:acyltransferase family protein [Dokdonia donghaensis]|uniref:Acyltransferase 3 domain-containing protein n=1 Tax=Dokdonia donghaensis DSW-1 TaxID=1300343 RepID=A0A0A2H4Y8_9FLAO|nr:acyltransferase [Dokdonia donghaensis]ANH60431.1 Acyltransferase family protein [Dokdonia donghaensis DSW-1]KGO07700.1 hypothetical protein NV36_13195 [Dokdonia donghaensis DSW-1]